MKLNLILFHKTMIEEENYDDQMLKYIPKMNFSYFTDMYSKMESKEFPTDNHHQIQRKWIQVIRNAIRTSNIQTVIIFLYSSKTYASHCRNILTSFFQKWKNHYKIHNYFRKKWIIYSNCIIYKSKHVLFDDVRNQMHEIRANRSCKHLISLPQYQSPNYGYFLKQINDNQIANTTARIGYRKKEKFGLCTTMTQTPITNSNFEDDNSDPLA